MVTVSHEMNAQAEARLRGVFRRSTIEWLPGLWAFVEQDDASGRGDSIADIRDDGHLSALCPAAPDATEEFEVFRVVLPRGEDDSGFVGWLSARIKAATGSGLFVVCGHNRQRGGIFDYYGVPRSAAAEVRTLLQRFATTELLDGVVMKAAEFAPDAGIGPETVFCFDQNGGTISARYGGGPIADGWLVGTVDPGTSEAAFHYLQIGVDGTVDSGHSVAEIRRLPDGRRVLNEHFAWTSRDGSGANRLEEIAVPGRL